MVKTASKTQENVVSQINSPASMETVSLLTGSVTATTTVRIIPMNWKEFVVRLDIQIKSIANIFQGGFLDINPVANQHTLANFSIILVCLCLLRLLFEVYLLKQQSVNAMLFLLPSLPHLLCHGLHL